MLGSFLHVRRINAKIRLLKIVVISVFYVRRKPSNHALPMTPSPSHTENLRNRFDSDTAGQTRRTDAWVLPDGAARASWLKHRGSQSERAHRLQPAPARPPSPSSSSLFCSASCERHAPYLNTPRVTCRFRGSANHYLPPSRDGL